MSIFKNEEAMARLRAFGAGWAGMNANAVWGDYQDQLRRKKQEAAIADLGSRMSISDDHRALLDTLSLPQQQQFLMQLDAENRQRLAAQRAAAGKAESERKRQEALQALLAPQPVQGTGALDADGTPNPVSVFNPQQMAAPKVDANWLRTALMTVDPKDRQMVIDYYKMNQPGERKIIEGADGYQYYQDTQERVLPNVEAVQKGFRMATPAEASQYGATAGQFGPDGRFYPIRGGMELVSDGKGGFTFRQGGLGQDNTKMDGTSPGAIIDTINGILNDEALDWSTGALEWTQHLPGTSMYRFGTRVRQLGGQVFLQAFEMLKGGGQITEHEGTKATEAMGRLDSGQNPNDYREALQELRTILGRAVARPHGWIDTSVGKISQMSAADINALDMESLSPEEVNAARARLTELVNEQLRGN